MNRKNVLVVGASTGIGHATAERFAKAGYEVYACARRTELMNDLNELGVTTFFMDICDDNSVKNGVEDVLAKEGRIDVLVNNAAYAQYGSFEDVTIEQARAQFDTNIFGYTRVLKAVLPGMRKRRAGRAINVTSSAGIIAAPIVTWYNASKFALEGLFDSLRREVAHMGIDVVMIEPGAIKTDLFRVAWEYLDKVDVSEDYKKMTAALKKDFSERAEKASGGEVIANLIYKAAKAKKPRTRYAAPMDARSFIFLKRILSDRMIDRILLSAMKMKQ